MKLLKKRVGKKIQQRRKEMGFKTQGDLAQKIGTDQPTIARWETGVYFPSDEYLEKLKEVLEVDSDFFFNEETSLSTDNEPLVRVANRENVSSLNEYQRNVLDQMAKLVERVDELESELEAVKTPKRTVPDLSSVDPDILEALPGMTPAQRAFIRETLDLPAKPATRAGKKPV